MSIASTGKDGTTGRLVTHTYRVRGPGRDLPDHDRGRCRRGAFEPLPGPEVDEDREQTRKIHGASGSARPCKGLVADRERRAVLKVHQDAQRLLEPVAVVNPFATALWRSPTPGPGPGGIT